jgi:glycosyltransferase involved in cell wall biosynthesis
VNEAHLTHRVRLLGHVTGLEKYELMARSFAVLMPSRYESFGLVGVEAQAAGAPLVAFDVGPVREVTGGTGAALIPPFDLDAFAGAATDLVRRPEQRHELASAGRGWARRQADWSEIASRQEAFYLRVASAADRLRHR